MFFEYPKLLWLLVVPALLVLRYLYVELKDRRPHLRVSSVTPWKKGGKTVLGVIRHIPFVLRVAALSLIVVAIARPRSSTKVEKVDTEGIDIVLAMDVSTSMLARDFTPDRISAAKDIAIEFIAQRPSDRMGIVVFAGESYTQCPLTTDRATLINLMKEISTDLIEDGTAIGNGLATALARIKDRCQEPCRDPAHRWREQLWRDFSRDCRRDRKNLRDKGLHYRCRSQWRGTVSCDDPVGSPDAECQGGA